VRCKERTFHNASAKCVRCFPSPRVAMRCSHFRKNKNDAPNSLCAAYGDRDKKRGRLVAPPSVVLCLTREVVDGLLCYQVAILYSE
jgi:hypothetical protein